MPLVGVGKSIIGSVFHAWMLERAPAAVKVGTQMRRDARCDKRGATDVTRPKWSAGCRRRLIGWISINNHSDDLDGWLVGWRKINNFPDSKGAVGWL